MKNIAWLITCALSTLMVLPQISYAQEITLALKSPPTAVTIDGKNKEWGDKLAYHDTENNLYYTISNDKENLYLVIKTNDPKQQNSIILTGVTFSIDTKGRKKKSYSVTFPQKLTPLTNIPLNTSEQKQAFASKTNGTRKITVSGFKKDVDETEFYPGNGYRIETALNFDENGYLIYEEAIPLYLFHAEGADSEWSYSIKLNEVTSRLPARSQITLGNFVGASAVAATPAGDTPPPTSSGGRGGGRNSSGGSGMSGMSSQAEAEIIKASEFWGKFSLSK